MSESNLSKLKELSKYISETESTLSVFWIMNPAILCITKQGKFIKINPACYKILGYSPEELIGTNYISLIHPDDLHKTKQAEYELIDSGTCMGVVNRYKHKAGHWIYLSWNTKLDKHSGKLYAVAVDITQEYSKKQKLLAALENAPFGIFLTDKDGQCIYVNKRWKTVTGLTDEEAFGSGWMNGIAESERNFLLESWKAFTDNGNHLQDINFMCKTKYRNIHTGQETPVQIMSYTYGDREFVGYVDFCLCFDNESFKNPFTNE